MSMLVFARFGSLRNLSVENEFEPQMKIWLCGGRGCYSAYT